MKTNEEIYPGIKAYKESIKTYNIQRAFTQIESLLSEANSRLTSLEPWKKTGKEKGDILLQGLPYIYLATLLLFPFIPEATEKVMKAMGIHPDTTLDTPMNINLNTISKPDILFEKK